MGVKVGKVEIFVHRDAIDHVEWIRVVGEVAGGLGIVQGDATTHVDGCLSARCTARIANLHASQLTLQQGSHIGVGAVFDGFSVYLGDRCCHVTFLYGAIADDNDILDGLCIRLQGYLVGLGLGIDLDYL